MTCLECHNFGYREIMKTQDGDEIQAFCDCIYGTKLKSLSISFRLSDLRKIADGILPKLKEAKISPRKKSQEIIENLIKEVEKTIQVVEEVSKQNPV